MTLDKTSLQHLTDARNELYIAMRYLFLPLYALQPQVDKRTFYLATDGEKLLYHPMAIEKKWSEHPVLLNRAYLHTVLHCMFLHPFAQGISDSQGRGAFQSVADCGRWPQGFGQAGNDSCDKEFYPELWDIAADVAVEHIIDGLELRCVRRLISAEREQMYRELETVCPDFDAIGIYRYFVGLSRERRDFWESAGIFTVDDHCLWYHHMKPGNDDQDNPSKQQEDDREDYAEKNGGQKENSMTEQLAAQRKGKWEQTAKRVENECTGYFNNTGTEKNSIAKALRASSGSRFCYRDFLRKFAVNREETQVDMDSFDYGFYNYGFACYGNMPLIEELEYRESPKIEDFVIVLDTSGSCSGRLMQKFLDETFTILSEEDIFAGRTRIHVIQCDNQVQDDCVIRSRMDLERFHTDFEVKGLGGTDYRPAFAYVNRKIEEGELTNLKGLLYFTDGHGIYPKRKTAYQTAFLFFGEDDLQRNVPPWAIRVVLQP